MTNASNVALATVASFMALLHVGCASLISGGALLDYATTEQGARIDAPRSNSLRNVETLINGVTDSSLWNQGEGWKYTWRRYAGNIRTWYGRGSGSGTPSSRLKEGTAWVEVTFPEPRRINRVVVHGYQSETQKYAGVWYAYIQVRDSKDLKGIWKTPARVEQGRIITPGRPLGKVGPVTTFRFNAVNADAVRFVVFSMEDARQTRGEGYFYSYGNELNGIRLVEIEVTGTAGVSSSAPTVAAAPDPDSAAGMLVGDLMAAASTPSPPTDTEPTILPGTLVSNLIGGTKPTSTSPTANPADRVEEPKPKPQSTNPPAPYFELISPSGEPIRLSEYAGKVIVLHFWSMSQSYAYDATAAGVLVVQDLQARFDPDRVQVIGVAHCELDEQPVEEFMRRNDIEFPVGLANKGILEDYGIQGRGTAGGYAATYDSGWRYFVPRTFVIDAGGRIVRRDIYPIDQDALALITELVKAVDDGS